MTIAIVGGGICGLSLALNLHARGIACRVYEAAPEVKELGVGITLLPHAMREFTALGLGDELLAPASRTPRAASSTASASSSTRSRAARRPAISIPRSASIAARLHLRALSRRAGAASGRIASSPTACASASSRTRAARASCSRRRPAGSALPPVAADIVIACDGVNSALRKQLVGDSVVFTGINTWRGVTQAQADPRPAAAIMRIGSILTGKIVIYPIVDDIDGARQPAHQLDHRDQARHGRDERLEQAGRSRRFHFGLRELALRLARCRGADPQVGVHLRISDGRQGPARRAGPSAA